MGELVNLLNGAGRAFVAFAGHMLIQSSVLIVILAALDFVLHKRVKAVVRYWIWLLILAKLLLPPSLSSPISLVSWAGSRLPQTTLVSLPPKSPVVALETVPTGAPAPVANAGSRLQAAPAPVSKPAPLFTSAAPLRPGVLPTWPAVVLLAWMTAVVLMVVLLLQRVAFVHGLLAQAQEAPDALRALLEQCRRQMGVRSSVGIRLTGFSASPSVCGLLRPVILMPEPMIQQLEMPQLRSVLFHELAHIQRGDLWINLLQTLLQIVYLYHPLLWWANARIRAVREQAVDETVLAALGEEAEEYPRTLLCISKLAFGRPALSLRLLGVVESKRALTERIHHIVSRPFPRTAKLGWAGGVLVAVIAVTLLPMASAAPERTKTEGASQTGAGALADQITLSGRVMDSQGRPVPVAEVTLYQETPGEIGVLPIIEVLDRKTTGADGAFAFAVPKTAKDYRDGHVIARKAGLALAWATWPMREDQRLDLRLPGEPKELAGDVVDEAGRPIADAVVHIALAKIGKGENRRELRSTGFLQTKTNRNGHFVFTDMPAGATFEFLVEAPGRAPVGTIDISVYGREQCQFAPGQAGIRFTLPAEARIEGVVVEKAGGKPVGGIEVAAHSDRRGRGAPVPSQRAVTAPDGTFRLGSLSDGTCIVQLWTARGRRPEWVAEDVRTLLTAGQTKRDVRVQITKGAFIEALIKDTAGKPVEKVGVYFRRVGQEQGFGAPTDANGLARIRVLPGDYSVSQIFRPGYAPPETTDPVTVAAGQTQRVEYIVTAKPKVAGIVRDEAGNPLANIKVQATWIRMLSSVTGGAVSDMSGKFEIPWDTTSLARGGATVILVARDPAHNLAAALEISEDTGPLDLKLQPGVIVTGTVLNVAGRPLPGASARILLKVDRALMRLSWDELATAGPDGVFEIKAVPPERQYTVEVTADGYGKRSVPIAALDSQEKRHDIGRITLVSSDLSVSGVVVDANDQPVAGMEVSAFGDGQPDLRTVQTDAQGRFTIKGVCPGSIRLSVGAPGVSPRRGSAQAEAGATDVKVTVAERRSPQTYAPRRGASLKGKPLPPLKDLGIELPADAAGKMLLVCFWDMSQRPSRACLAQLAAQAGRLGEKGITIVPIHAARAEDGSLSDWMEKNKVPFQTGTITGDINKTKLAWGVDSLPHLILTDKKHTVVAEGFSLDEIDGILARTGDLQK